MFIDQMHKRVDTQALLWETEAIDRRHLPTAFHKELLVVLHGLLNWGRTASKVHLAMSEDMFDSQRCC